MSKWNENMEQCPESGFEVKTLGGHIFEAVISYGYIAEDGETMVHSYDAVGDDYPECWSGGTYWKSNENCVPSDPPVAWKLIKKDSPNE